MFTTTGTALIELAPAHMGPFLTAAGGNRRLAVELFGWDRVAAAGVQITLGLVEVVVRSSLDAALSRWAVRTTQDASADWISCGMLPSGIRRELKGARFRAASADGGTPDHRGIVSHCTFGFWRGFSHPKYHSRLWLPAAHSAFAHGPDDLAERRRAVHALLGSLVTLRNDAAHLTPLIERDLAEDLVRARTIAGWISPAAAAVVERTSPLPRLVAAKPSPAAGMAA